MINSPPLCCQGALSRWPLTIHPCLRHDVATWGQSADSSSWHPPHSQPLTHYKRGYLPAQWFPCCLTAVQHKSRLALLTRALRGTMRGQTGRPPWKTTFPVAGWVYWQITISVLPEWYSSHAETDNLRNIKLSLVMVVLANEQTVIYRSLGFFVANIKGKVTEWLISHEDWAPSTKYNGLSLSDKYYILPQGPLSSLFLEHSFTSHGVQCWMELVQLTLFKNGFEVGCVVTISSIHRSHEGNWKHPIRW